MATSSNMSQARHLRSTAQKAAYGFRLATGRCTRQAYERKDILHPPAPGREDGPFRPSRHGQVAEQVDPATGGKDNVEHGAEALTNTQSLVVSVPRPMRFIE